jgi:signal transduction histidine kinase
LWNAALVYGIVLVLLGMGSIPLARWITRPLERLTTVTQAFGLGDLRARADTSRRDEVGDLARAFNTMADRVESLRRTEKELLANVSHELRTPLARIRVLLELAEDDVPNDAKRYLGDISDDLTELEQLLADVIATAKFDVAHASQQDPYPPLRLLPVSTSELLESIVGKFRRQHLGRIVTAQFDSESTLLADRVMLTHAISNILDNAEKYSPPALPIGIFIKTQDSSVVIIVRDSGVGIASDDLPNVFTPFFRADPSRTRRTGGVGLGLTLAKRLIEAHGGSIAIESHLGQGTEVTVRLPSISNIAT